MLVMVTLTTALLSLDAAAVLVTPIIVALAGHVGLSPLRFALSTVWLANTASLSLPMSSLTNLLAADVFGDHPVDFVEVAWAPALTGMAMGIHRRSLTHRFALVERSDSRTVLRLLLPVSVAAAVGALFLLAAFAVRNRRLSAQSRTRLDLRPVADHRIRHQLRRARQLRRCPRSRIGLGRDRGIGDGSWSLLQLAAVGALGANTMNNLPLTWRCSRSRRVLCAWRLCSSTST